jgi:hypothetical protein
MLQNTGGRPVLRMHFPANPLSGVLPSNMVEAMASALGQPYGHHTQEIPMKRPNQTNKKRRRRILKL